MPSYEPAGERLPRSDTVTVSEAPAASVTVAGASCTLRLESASRGCTARLKVADAELTFVIRNVRLMLTVVEVIAPNEIVAGSKVAATFTASTTFSLPEPAEFTRANPLASSILSVVGIYDGGLELRRRHSAVLLFHERDRAGHHSNCIARSCHARVTAGVDRYPRWGPTFCVAV